MKNTEQKEEGFLKNHILICGIPSQVSDTKKVSKEEEENEEINNNKKDNKKEEEMKKEMKKTENTEIVNNAAAAAKKEKTYTDASLCMKNRIANKNFKKEFATLNGARWLFLQEVGKMATTTTPFTYTVNEAKTLIDNNKEQITPTKSGRYTVNVLISFINKKIKEREKEQKENAQKDLLCSRQIKKNTKNLYCAGGLI